MPVYTTSSTHVFMRFMIAGSAFAALAACQPKAAQPPGGGFPPAEVSIIVVQPKTVPVTFEYVGQTAGSREVEVRARVNGILQKRNYREGGAVQMGQSLFIIDPAPFEAARARAEADMAGADARLGQARRNAARLKPLIEANAVSQKDYDDAVSSEQIAAADLKSAKARLTEASLNMEYTMVKSPATGYTSRALRSEGNLISGPEVLLTTITQIDPIRVNFGIAGDWYAKWTRDLNAGRLKLPADDKLDVRVKLPDGTIYAKRGQLDFIDQRTSTTTGTIDAHADLPNPDSALKPGQFVRVQITGATRPNAILVPQRAVLEGPKGKFVYVVNDGKAESRPVEVGDWSDDTWVVDSGLKAGDQVIVDGVMKIGPGAPVHIAQPATDAKAPPAAGKATPSDVGNKPSGKQ